MTNSDRAMETSPRRRQRVQTPTSKHSCPRLTPSLHTRPKPHDPAGDRQRWDEKVKAAQELVDEGILETAAQELVDEGAWASGMVPEHGSRTWFTKGHGPRAWAQSMAREHGSLRGMGLGHGPRAWLTNMVHRGAWASGS